MDAEDVEAAGTLAARPHAAIRAQVMEQAPRRLGRVDDARRAVRLAGHQQHAGHRQHPGRRLLAHTAQSMPPWPGSGRAEGPITAPRRPDET
jgi:hypothetical protein